MSESTAVNPDNLPPALPAAALAFLVGLRRDQVRPEQAEERFQIWREPYGAVGLDLVWEIESFAGTVHYDLLVHAAGGTFSLSFCPDQELPWAVRGIQRWSEAFVARVNGAPIDVGTAFAAIDALWSEVHVGRRLVESHVIAAAKIEGCDVTGAELQEALDEHRRRRGLFSAGAMHGWLRDHGMSQERLTEQLSRVVRGRKLRDKIAGGRQEAYFAQHQADFERLRLLRVHFEDEREAEELASRVRASASTLGAAAVRRFAEGARIDVRLVRRMRRDIDPAHAPLLTARSGELLGPLRSGDGWDVIELLARDAPRLDRETHDAISEQLFSQWLAEQVSAARVEWFWGESEPVQLPA